MEARTSAAGQSGRIFIFGFLSAIAPLSIDIYLPALPMLRQTLAADEAQTLLTLSAFFIGFGGGQLLFGPLSDRFGRKPLLLVGLTAYWPRRSPARCLQLCLPSCFGDLCRHSVDPWCQPLYRRWSGSLRPKPECQGFVP